VERTNGLVEKGNEGEERRGERADGRSAGGAWRLHIYSACQRPARVCLGRLDGLAGASNASETSRVRPARCYCAEMAGAAPVLGETRPLDVLGGPLNWLDINIATVIIGMVRSSVRQASVLLSESAGGGVVDLMNSHMPRPSLGRTRDWTSRRSEEIDRAGLTKDWLMLGPLAMLYTCERHSNELRLLLCSSHLDHESSMNVWMQI
jgi:hypothetical protein